MVDDELNVCSISATKKIVVFSRMPKALSCSMYNVIYIPSNDALYMYTYIYTRRGVVRYGISSSSIPYNY